MTMTDPIDITRIRNANVAMHDDFHAVVEAEVALAEVLKSEGYITRSPRPTTVTSRARPGPSR